MNAEEIGEAWRTQRGKEGPSPRGAFPPCLGPDTALVMLIESLQVGVLMLQDWEINFAVDRMKLALSLEVSGRRSAFKCEQ